MDNQNRTTYISNPKIGRVSLKIRQVITPVQTFPVELGCESGRSSKILPALPFYVPVTVLENLQVQMGVPVPQGISS